MVELHYLLYIFSEELTSIAEQKTVHITPNRAEFLQSMISHYSDDYKVFSVAICVILIILLSLYRKWQGIKETFTS